ncbi:YebC/PmpR family DNA-binding transcriptional regulator [Candidatus Uhrbacteria bacterium]|nr:YebC/PmpR family DNA-binding transcriptional regulator [Candidatus Uhrbacteria bacterium]
MSGHSKWHNIQERKGKSDKKKAGVFGKLTRAITVAARGGGDPAFNFQLRMAVDAAKAANMPKENVDRAIARGAGGEDGVQLDEVIYEGFGPGGVGILVKCLTDNRNRTITDLKTALTRNNGSFAAAGSVAWQFERKGVIRMEEGGGRMEDRQDFELSLIDLGADDVSEEEGRLIVKCPVDHLSSILKACEGRGSSVSAEISYLPKTRVELSQADGEAFGELCEAIDDLDDVETIYSNAA